MKELQMKYTIIENFKNLSFKLPSTTNMQYYEYILVPVSLRILVKGWKYDGKYSFSVVTDKTHDVFVIPEKKCTFGNL